MKNDTITTLYRYTTAKRAICVLKSMRIYFPQPASFNDPFDCAIDFDKEITAADLIQSSFLTYQARGHSWPAIKEILDQWIQDDGTVTKTKQQEMLGVAQEFVDKNAEMGVLSLSETPLSPLMWAHYADMHQGVCLGFARSPANTLGDDDITSPVSYSDIYPRVRFSEILKRDGSIHKKIFFTKAREWAYEREWRLLADKGGELKKVPGEVSEVILGCRIAPADSEAIVNICAQRDIVVSDCEAVPGTFQYRRRTKA